MQTSAKNEIEITYAGFLVRFIAFIIDTVIVAIAAFLIQNVVLSGLINVEIFSNPLFFNISIADIFMYAVKVSYFIICICSAQTTLGKYVMKLKVVDKNGEKLSTLAVIYRETIGRFLSSFLYVGYLLIFIDKEKTALHDKLADSRVIYACTVKKTVIVQQRPVMPPMMPPVMNGPMPNGPVNKPMNGMMPNGPINKPMNGMMPNGPINQPMNGPIPNEPINQPMNDGPIPNEPVNPSMNGDMPTTPLSENEQL